MATKTNYSVLMSVYIKEKPEYLATAMQSIFDQTVLTDDFVLVCDGPLTPELDAVISQKLAAYPEILHVVRLEKNGGLGNALNVGIQHCRNELIARMDSDDICRPTRCEKQLALFRNKPELSIVSGIVEEFSSSPDIVDSRRVPPETHPEILAFARKRNPFNHPSVMYKKQAVEDAGGYQDFYLLEDYYLWIRMLQSGAIGYNIQEPLLWMRAGSELFKRRAGWKHAFSQEKLFRYMLKTGFISFPSYLGNSILRIGASLSSNRLRTFMFKTFVRK